MLSLIAASLIAATCALERVEVARADRSVYLDPSQENRSAVTRAVIQKVLAPLRSSHGSFECVRETIIALSTFGTPGILRDTFRQEAFAYSQEYEKGRDPEIARTGALFTAAAGRLDDIARISPVAAEPRDWKLEEVKGPVAADHRMTTALVIAMSGTSAVVAIGRDSTLDKLLDLGRMGVLSGLQRIDPRLVPLDRFNRDFPIGDLPHAEWAENFPHFRHERELYTFDWNAAHPCPKPCDGLSGSERSLRAAQTEAYVQRMWLKTDDDAPHPAGVAGGSWTGPAVDEVREPCRSLQVDVAKEFRPLFIDPASSARIAMTQRLVERIVKPLESPELLGADGMPACAAMLLSSIAEFGDAQVAERAFKEFQTSYDELDKAVGLPEFDWHVVELGANLGARNAARAIELHATSSLPEIESLQVKQCEPTRREAEALVRTLALLPAGAERFRAVFALPDGHSDPCLPGHLRYVESRSRRWSVDALARRWAIAQITSDPDPRNWSVPEVARMIVATRSPLFDGSAPQPTREKLRKFGFLRACELMSQPTRTQSGTDRCTPQTKPPAGYARDILLQHFPFESSLYEFEWLSEHPEPANPTGPEWKKWDDERSTYLDARWLETDDAAPHQSVGEIEAALRAISSDQKPRPVPRRE